MQKAVQFGKKALSWGVVATTIAWSVGVAAIAAPLAAKAAVTLPAGSLVKRAASPAVYYVGTDGKRHAFPDAKVHNSWYPDFVGVTTLSDADLGSIPLSGLNIVHRAGAYLVKINTVPTVYAVAPGGVLRAVSSAAVAEALWGSGWGTRVRDIDDSVFGNYTLGSDITSNTYPTGALVKTASSPDIYYIDGTSKRKITADGFTANRFRFEFVVTTTLDLSVYVAGTDISTGDTAFNDTAQLGGGGSGTVGTGSGLTVAVGSNNPVAATIVDDATGNTGAQALIPFLKLKLSASADGSVTVSGLKLRRGGITADSNIGEVYLYEGDTILTQLGRSTTISAGIITLTGLNISIPAGGMKEVMVRANLAVPSSSNSSKTMSMSLEAADVTVAGSTAVSGSAVGNTMTITTVTDLGQAQFENITPSAANTVDPGQTGYELWRFKVTAADQDMIVRKLVFTQIGSVQDTALQNFKLMDGATQLGSTVPAMTSSKVVIDLSGMTDGGYKVTNGQVKQLGLVGDIIGGSGRTYRFSIQERTDAIVWDKNYQVYTIPAKGPTGCSTACSFSVIEPNSSGTAVSTTVNSGRLTISTASDSPATNVPSGATNVTIAKWTFTAAGEDVKVDNLVAACLMSTTSDILKNVKLVLDGAQVGTTAATDDCDGTGPTSAFSFGNSFVVPAGSTKVLSYVADLTHSTVAAGDTIIASLTAGTSNAQGTVTLNSINTSSATGRTVTVQSGALVVTEDASFVDRTGNNPTGVLGAQSVLIGQFVVTGGGEDADVTQIVLTDATSTPVTMAGTFQNLKLWKVNADGTTSQVGNTVGTLTATAGTTYTFTPTSPIRATAGGTTVFQISADIKSGGTVVFGGGVVYPSLVSATGVTTGTSVSDADGTAAALQNVHVITNGALSVYPASATPIAQTFVMGSTANELARFTLAATIPENINITRIVISDLLTQEGASTTNATSTLKNLKLINASTGVQYGGTIASLDSVTSTAAPVAVFDSISNLQVARNGNLTFKVVADVGTQTQGGGSSTTHRLTILPNITSGNAAVLEGNTSAIRGIVATGQDSGWSISGSSLDFNQSSTNSNTDVWTQSNVHRVYKTRITITKASDAPNGLTSVGSQQTVAKFVVTNASNVDNQAATLQLMNLDIASTISNTNARVIAIWKDTAGITANSLASTSTNATAQIAAAVNFVDTALTDATFVQADGSDPTIDAGSSRTFVVTADTTDAVSLKTFSAGLDLNDIIWNDGVTLQGINIVDSLPVVGNTLTY